MNTYMLLGLDQNNNVTVAKLASSYAGTQPLEYLSKTALGAGKTASGGIVLLRLSSTGELVS